MIVNDKSSERVLNVENLIAVASLSPCFTDDLLGLQYDNGISVDTSMPLDKQISIFAVMCLINHFPKNPTQPSPEEPNPTLTRKTLLEYYEKEVSGNCCKRTVWSREHEG